VSEPARRGPVLQVEVAEGVARVTLNRPEVRNALDAALLDGLESALRRLEDEQREFHDFLGRLRMAKDKAEFDQFMAERRNRPNPGATPDTQPQA